MGKIYVLEKSKYWHEIDEKDLSKWIQDGSITEGDLVVYPKKVFVAKEQKVVKLEEVM